mgnify:CR=1 FL=1
METALPVAAGAQLKRKICTIEVLVGKIQEYKAKGQTVVQCHGVFDLLHPGHIRHFDVAKKEGDILIVTITPDHLVNKGPGRPIFEENLRAESLAALEVIDHVVINKWPTAVEAISLLQPNVYVKGSDYTECYPADSDQVWQL